MEQNPYLPPAAPNEPPQGNFAGYPSRYPFKHLGWKTTLTMIGLGVCAVGSVLNHALSPLLEAENPNLLLAFVVGGIGLGTGLVSLATMVLFLIWAYSAAANVRAFGNELLRISPGWAVAWWFIPFASLWKPYQAMSEAWRASDVSARQVSTVEWTKRSAGALVKAWWALYLSSGLIATFSIVPVMMTTMNAVMRGETNFTPPHPSFALGMIAEVLSLGAAICAILVLREITRRQDEMALQMGITSI